MDTSKGINKRSTWRRAIFCLLPLPVGLAACGGGNATDQDDAAVNYPQKTIEMIVPWSAGGDTDTIFRLIGEGLTDELGQSVVIRNVAGGGGSVGAEQALNASNDGYTILAGHDSIAISNLTGQTDFGYSAFEPVALMTSSYFMVAARPDSPWDDMEDVLAEAAEKPGTLSFAASIGSTSQLLPALIQTAADVEFNVVGYEDTAGRTQALIGGHVDLAGMSPLGGKEYVDAGDMTFLAYTGAERSDAVPDMPTLTELGLDVVAGTNRGLFLPEGTPDSINETLNDALAEIAESDTFVSRLESLDTDVNYLDADDYDKWLDENVTDMEEAMTRAGMI